MYAARLTYGTACPAVQPQIHNAHEQCSHRCTGKWTRAVSPAGQHLCGRLRLLQLLLHFGQRGLGCLQLRAHGGDLSILAGGDVGDGGLQGRYGGAGLR